MASVAASRGDFLETACPTWFAPVPEKKAKANSGDWFHVTMVKRDTDGDLITYRGKPVHFHYHLEKSTGDLYGVQGEKKGIDSRFAIAAKAMGIFVNIPLYVIGMMGWNFIRIVYDISAIFWRVIPQFVRDIYKKGFISSLGNVTMAITWEIPIEVIKDIWRIARSPIYGFGMMVASLYTVACPLEGRKWLGQIEYEWHEGASYKMDIRHGKSKKQIDDLTFSEFLSDLKGGKIFYIGYCMQKRGNLSEKSGSKPRFEILEAFEKRINKAKSKNPSWLSRIFKAKTA